MWTVSFTFLPLKLAAGAWAAFLVPYYTLSALGDFPHTGALARARRAPPPPPPPPPPPLLPPPPPPPPPPPRARASGTAAARAAAAPRAARTPTRAPPPAAPPAGCREWRWLLVWFRAWVEPALAHWFGSVRVIYDARAADRAAHAAPRAPPVAVAVEGAGGRAWGAAQRPAPDAGPRGREAEREEEGGGWVRVTREAPRSDAEEEEGEGARARGGPRAPQAAQGQQVQQTQHAQAAQAQAQAAQAQAQAAQARMIFGFHPHGFYPTGAGFLPMTASFRAALPGVAPATLVASVLFAPPFLRDIGAWSGFRKVRNLAARAPAPAGAAVARRRAGAPACSAPRGAGRRALARQARRRRGGGPPGPSKCACAAPRAPPARQVSRSTFLCALRERGSVVLCPGGQAEMCHTHRMFPRPAAAAAAAAAARGGKGAAGGGGGGGGGGGAPELVLHARHKGFCKARTRALRAALRRAPPPAGAPSGAAPRRPRPQTRAPPL